MESPTMSDAMPDDSGIDNESNETAKISFVKQAGGWIAGFVLFGVGILLLIALFSASKYDPSFNRVIVGESVEIQNWLGRTGAVLADVLLQTLGVATLLMPLVLGGWGWRLAKDRRISQFLWRFIVLVPVLLVASFLFYGTESSYLTDQRIGKLGGVVGAMFTSMFLQYAPIHTIVYAKIAAGVFVFTGFLYAFALQAEEWKWIFSRLVSGIMFVLSQSGYYLVTFTQKYHQVRQLGNKRSVNSKMPMVPPVAPLSEEKSNEEESSWTKNTLEENTPNERDNFWQGVSSLDQYPQEQGEHQEPQQQPENFPEEPIIRKDVREEPIMSRVAQPSSKVPLPQSEVLTSDSNHEITNLTPQGIPQARTSTNSDFDLPSLSLLKSSDQTIHQRLTPEEQREISERLVKVLQDFGVHGDIKTAPSPGPVVTLYEFEPAPGTRTRKVTDLSEDVARSMSLHSVRMSTMTGRNSIAVELPNKKRAIVKLRDVLQCDEYQKNTMKLPLVLGCDIGGKAEVVDLATMPHLLIAGTTGSGKSVGLNVMILSLLYRYQPDECRFIMIDPKMLELSIYQDIPHLLSPVVTDPKKAVVALKWAVKEMEERYFMMSRVGVRNVESFNMRVKELNGEPIRRKIHKGFDEDGKAIEEEEVLPVKHYPYIVVIVDEMADLMLVAGKEIEALIQRLAQMARAAGIHIVMATQRPSVDVVTGTIKANFPTRISFMVSSKIDSRTVLGDSGAEQLLGKGDMLMTSGGGKLRRIHGPFVEDGEVEAVCQFLRSQSLPVYEQTVLEEPAGDSLENDASSNDEAKDVLFDDAVGVIKHSGKASTSLLQRQLQIGYNRAARLMDMIEAAGLVSAPDHAGKREILMGNEDNEARYR